MNLRDLKYLVAVADLKNFRKAAEACHISQPTLSMQIKKLEDYLQVKLIERGNRKIMLTEAGNEIVSKARDILKLSDEIISASQNFRNPLSGDVKIGAFPTLAPYYFPKLMPIISKSFPKLNIYLVEEKTEKLIELLKKGEIDAAFLALPIKDKMFNVEEVFEEKFLLAAPKSFHWGNMRFNKEALSLKDIKGQKLLLLEEGHCLREQALGVCELAGAGENKGFRATSLETLRNMVAAGMGLTLIPELAKHDNDGLRYMEFEGGDAKRNIALVWRKESQRTELFANMVEKIRGI